MPIVRPFRNRTTGQKGFCPGRSFSFHCSSANSSMCTSLMVACWPARPSPPLKSVFLGRLFGS